MILISLSWAHIISFSVITPLCDLSIFQVWQNYQTFLRFLFCATRLRLSLELISPPAFYCNFSLKINSLTLQNPLKNCLQVKLIYTFPYLQHGSTVYFKFISAIHLCSRSQQLCKQAGAPTELLINSA